MTDQELRDHCEELLLAVAADLDTAQTSQEQSQKSKVWAARRAWEYPDACTRTDGFIRDLPSSRCSPSFVRFAPLCCGSTN